MNYFLICFFLFEFVEDVVVDFLIVDFIGCVLYFLGEKVGFIEKY